jgi:hypothetical protein
MFALHCPRHQTRVLLGARSIDSVVNTDAGIVVHWHCHCGWRGTVLTGHPRHTEPAAA